MAVEESKEGEMFSPNATGRRVCGSDKLELTADQLALKCHKRAT